MNAFKPLAFLIGIAASPIELTGNELNPLEISVKNAIAEVGKIKINVTLRNLTAHPIQLHSPGSPSNQNSLSVVFVEDSGAKIRYFRNFESTTGASYSFLKIEPNAAFEFSLDVDTRNWGRAVLPNQGSATKFYIEFNTPRLFEKNGYWFGCVESKTFDLNKMIRQIFVDEFWTDSP